MESNKKLPAWRSHMALQIDFWNCVSHTVQISGQSQWVSGQHPFLLHCTWRHSFCYFNKKEKFDQVTDTSSVASVILTSDWFLFRVLPKGLSFNLTSLLLPIFYSLHYIFSWPIYILPDLKLLLLSYFPVRVPVSQLELPGWLFWQVPHPSQQILK